MTNMNLQDSDGDGSLDAAISAVLSEPVPSGPPVSVATNLAEAFQVSAMRSSRNNARSKWLPLTVAASVLACCVLFLRMLESRQGVVWADVGKEVRKAKNIQFRRVGYAHAFGDENETIACRRTSYTDCCFKLPGFRREVHFDEHGVPWKIETTDAVRGITLELNIQTKEAVLTEQAPPSAYELRQGLESNFEMLENWLKEGKILSELGERRIQGHNAIGLRVSHPGREADFWVDRQTRQIVRFLEPTVAVYDPDNDPVAKNPVFPQSKSYGTTLKGWIWTDIVYDAQLDDAQFVLIPPEDYSVKRIKYREPTEKELTDLLEVFAHVRGGNFTDDENSPDGEPAEWSRIHDKPADQRSVWEQKLILAEESKPKVENGEEIRLKGGGKSVLVRFHVNYHGTWHYQGKGVKLGDGQTAVCWYRPHGSTSYRVIYGDLSVKDVAQADLPPKR